MRAATSIISLAAFSVGLAAAQGSGDHDGPPVNGDTEQIGEATIEVEVLSGGTHQSASNITVPLDEVYTNPEILDKVSTLSVVYYDGNGDLTIYCRPFKATNGKGDFATTFSNGEEGPAYLSTNTVVVGSIVCLADYD